MKKSLLLLVILLAGFAEGASYNCSSCADCTGKIENASAGDVVYLITNITNQSGVCVEFSYVNDITFDCRGNSIEGNADNGIEITGGSDNKVKNCYISGFVWAIVVFYANSTNITNNVVRSNEIGILIGGSYNTHVTNNTLYDNGEYGIQITGLAVVEESENGALTENTVGNNWCGILLEESDNFTISRNNVTNNTYGLALDESNDDDVTNNTFNFNVKGIYIDDSWYAVIEDNQMDYNDYGISLVDSDYSLLKNNTLNYNNNISIYIQGVENTLISNRINKSQGSEGLFVRYTNQNITTSNSINGLPIQYYDGEYRPCPDNEVLSFDLSEQNISHLQLNGCTNVSIRNLNTSNLDGIYLIETSDSKVENCVSNYNRYGIYSESSDNNEIENCVLKNSYYGAYFTESNNNIISQNIANNNTETGIMIHVFSSYNILVGNTLNSNSFSGISIGWSEAYNNNITQNTITSNGYGIYGGIHASYKVYHNDFVSNTQNTYLEYASESDSWINGSEGNYWSDYVGNDSNGDGIGDTPYNIGGGNYDNYPLMEPYNVVSAVYCELNGNYPPCDEVTLSEVVDHINLWSACACGLADVIDLINAWVNGTGS